MIMKSAYRTERAMLADTLLKEGPYKSIREMVCRIRAMIPQNPLLSELDRNGNVVTYSVKDFYDNVMNLGDGLIDAGLKGAHIAIMAENSCRYIMADICISSGVGVVVPIDKDAPVQLAAQLLKACDADAVMCDASLVEKLRGIQQLCPRLKTIITMNKPYEGLPDYDSLCRRGAEIGEDGPYRTLTLDMEAPAKILFTSGTTGPNKGVVLTNANLIANLDNCEDTITAESEDNTSLSVLPMHHATEINTHIMTRIAGGRLTYINGNMRNMMKNLSIFKPTVITVVPMIANAFYKGIWNNAAKSGKDAKLRKGIKISNLLRKIGIDRTHTMFAEVFAPFGGRLKMIVCGGSMLNPEVVKGLNDLGIHLENGYGITECGPLVSMNSDTLHEHLSVGKICPGLEAKLADVDENGVGELCVRGKSVFKGYYNDPDATAAVFDGDGFFRTGDSARIDRKTGHVYLVGRKKNTIVLENGKNICPEEIENTIETNLQYAEEVVVYQAVCETAGVGRQVLCAGLYIEDPALRADRARIKSDIMKTNSLLPSYKALEFIELPESPYEKTSTRKIKRSSLPAKCSQNGIKI